MNGQTTETLSGEQELRSSELNCSQVNDLKTFSVHQHRTHSGSDSKHMLHFTTESMLRNDVPGIDFEGLYFLGNYVHILTYLNFLCLKDDSEEG